MEILKGVLKEELKRLQDLGKQYSKLIEELPKGSLVRKKRRESIYYYLAHRKGKKVVFDYVGKLNPKDLEKLLDKIDERKKINKLNSQVKKDIKKLEKMIK